MQRIFCLKSRTLFACKFIFSKHFLRNLVIHKKKGAGKFWARKNPVALHTSAPVYLGTILVKKERCYAHVLLPRSYCRTFFLNRWQEGVHSWPFMRLVEIAISFLCYVGWLEGATVPSTAFGPYHSSPSEKTSASSTSTWVDLSQYHRNRLGPRSQPFDVMQPVGFLFSWVCCKIWLGPWLPISRTGLCNSCIAPSLSLDTFCQRSLFGFMPWDFFFQNW